MRYVGVVTDRSWDVCPHSFFAVSDDYTRNDLLDYYQNNKGCFQVDEMEGVDNRRIYSDEVPMAGVRDMLWINVKRGAK